jgi:hypothetical protein
MKGIGGNLNAVFQTRATKKNAIGESEKAWTDVQTIRGWLDLSSGNSGYNTYSAKIQESTHIFVADYVQPNFQAESARAIINSKHYDVMLIDNPMEMGEGSQLEIYLKYTGGQ